MNILIITHYFPPLNAVASFRPLGWAKHWSRKGHHITVLTTEKKPWHGPLIEKNCENYLPNYIVFPVSYPSPSTFFTKYEKNSFVKTSLKISRILGLGISKITGFYFNQPHLWIIPAAKAAWNLHKKFHFDIVVSTFSPPESHFIAAYLKKKDNKIFWNADFRDLWYGNHYYAGLPPFNKIEKGIQNIVLKNVDMLSTVSSPLQAALSRLFPDKPVYVFTNGFDPDCIEMAKRKGKFFSKNKKTRIVYTGRIYRKKQDIDCLFEALNKIKTQDPVLFNRLEVHFFGVSNKIIGTFLRKYPRIKMIIFTRNRVDHLTSLRIQQDADLLIFFDWNDQKQPGILTGKIFEYLASGTPILFIGSTLISGVAKIIQCTKSGFFAKNSQTAADIIMKIAKKDSISFGPDTSKIRKFSKDIIDNEFLETIIQHLKSQKSINSALQ